MTCTFFPSETIFYENCHKIDIMSQSGEKSPDQPDPAVEIDAKGARTLTEKALQNYEAQKIAYRKKVNPCWDKVNHFLTENVGISENMKTLEKEIKKSFSKYYATVTDYMNYLIRVGPKDSLGESQLCNLQLDQSQKLVKNFNDKLSAQIKTTAQDTGSVLSSSSSRLSNVLTMKHT